MKALFEELAQPFLVRIIEEDKEVIASKLEEVWKSKKDSIVLDGFRKGKVPQNIAEKAIGFEKLYKEYLDQLIMDAISNVSKEHNVTIMDLQQVVPDQLNSAGISMQAVVYLKPEIRELDYTNVKVTKLNNDASEDEISWQLNQLAEQQALLNPVEDRGVKFEDMITISFTGYIDGVPFQGGQASKQTMQLRENSFIPGFGEQIIDMKSSESKTIKVTFPADYRATNLAGKDTTFDITIHEIKEKHVPELNDEFASTAGFETLDALKTNIKNAIEKNKKAENKKRTESEICMTLVERAKMGVIPQTMIQKRLGGILQQESNTVNMTPENYLKKRGMAKDIFDRSYYSTAVRDLKIQLILEHVAQKEVKDISEEETQEYIKSESERLGYTIEQIKQIVTDEQIENQVKARKAYDFLLEQAIYEEKVG